HRQLLLLRPPAQRPAGCEGQAVLAEPGRPRRAREHLRRRCHPAREASGGGHPPAGMDDYRGSPAHLCRCEHGIPGQPGPGALRGSGCRGRLQGRQREHRGGRSSSARSHHADGSPRLELIPPRSFVCILHARLLPSVFFLPLQGVCVARPSPAHKLRWQLITYLAAGLVLMPLLVLLFSWQSVDQTIWGHLLQTQLARLVGNSRLLVLGLGAGVILLGRRWLDWALMLPFAIPAYVLAFVMVGLLDFAGPLQTLLRGWFGNDFRLPPIRSTGGVILTLVLVFYPYVYMLARSAFMAQGRG